MSKPTDSSTTGPKYTLDAAKKLLARKIKVPQFGPAGEQEAQLQGRIKRFLEKRGWLVLNMHGNMYQAGVPDLWCAHAVYGVRWVEVKRPDRWSFTNDQSDTFPRIVGKGVGIWVMQDTKDYPVLNGPPNIGEFMNVKTGKKLRKSDKKG